MSAEESNILKSESLPQTDMRRRTLLIALFSHAEVYPPTLNAIFHLAPLFDEVHILVRNVWESNWQYPDNVRITTSGKYVPLEKVGQNSLVGKVRAYFDFGTTLRNLFRRNDPAVVLLYDAAAFSLFHLFAGKLARERKPLVWYHNHDVSVEEEVGRFSLMRVMKRLEVHYFHRAGIFSLPNHVRLKYFPVRNLRTRPFVIPNYPSRFFFGRWRGSDPAEGAALRLIFQGHISPSQRIEDFLEILQSPVAGHDLELHLAGPVHADYQTSLEKIAVDLGVRDRLFFYGRLPYADLPALTASCHVGIAIYGQHNTMVRTMSTASNKIFEYASVGLPVVINHREDLQQEFKCYPWIHFAEETPASLKKVLESIISQYSLYSSKARSDFEHKLNFETAFAPLQERLKRELSTP